MFHPTVDAARCGSTRITGNGLHQRQILRDSSGALGDSFGAAILLFRQFSTLHIAVSAVSKGDGAVFVYRAVNSSYFSLQQILSNPTTQYYVTSFGRSIHYDGTQLLVSSIARYKTGLRFQVSALNQKGTRYFIESTGINAIDYGDPIFVFRSLEGRANSTSLTLVQTIADGDYTRDFGASIAISSDMMAVGASVREEFRYGHGTDGDLEVTGVKFLDGSATYNYNNVIVHANATLTVERFEEIRGRGGILTIRVKNSFIVEAGGTVNLTEAGYTGGPQSYQDTTEARDGLGPGGGKRATSTLIGVLECDYDRAAALTSLRFENTGLGTARTNSTLDYAEASGGGGGYATPGLRGALVQCGDSGAGGTTYGNQSLEDLWRGSGGGSGHPWNIGSGGAGGNGGWGDLHPSTPVHQLWHH